MVVFLGQGSQCYSSSMIALGTRGFFLHVSSRLTDSSVEGWSHKPQFARKNFCMGHYKDLTETGNCSWKVSGTQGINGWCLNIFWGAGGGGRGGNTIGHFRVPLGLCIKMRFSVQPLIWKWFFILMQINLIFPRKAVHLASFWKQGFLELGGDLFCCCETCFTCNYLKG